jgi:hypothetical protein
MLLNAKTQTYSKLIILTFNNQILLIFYLQIKRTRLNHVFFTFNIYVTSPCFYT